MMSTTYINASGLPANKQITFGPGPANCLGCTIQDLSLPEYYRYFPRQVFGVEIRRSQRLLLGQLEGVDYTKPLGTI